MKIFKDIFKGKRSRKIVVVMAAALMSLTTVASSNAIWKDYKPNGGFDGRWKRFYGRDRIKTAEYTANSLNPHINATDVAPLKNGESVPTVLVNENSFQDGLSAYNLCKSLNARLLLIKPTYANVGLMKDYYKSKVVYLLGTTSQISPSTESYIKKNMPGTKVIRIGDKDPYQRNIQTLKISGLNNVAVADGRNFPDALASSGLLNNKNLGLLLVKGDTNYTLPSNLNVVYTIGGTNSVNKDAGKRLAGGNRYQTAVAVAKEASGYDNLILINGKAFPDSISCINLVKPRNAIVLPIADGQDNSYVKEFLAALPETRNTNQWDVEKSGYALVVGGENSVRDNTVLHLLYPSNH